MKSLPVLFSMVLLMAATAVSVLAQEEHTGQTNLPGWLGWLLVVVALVLIVGLRIWIRNQKLY